MGDCGAGAGVAQALSSVGVLSPSGFENAVVGKQAYVVGKGYHAESAFDNSCIWDWVVRTKGLVEQLSTQELDFCISR